MFVFGWTLCEIVTGVFSVKMLQVTYMYLHVSIQVKFEDEGLLAKSTRKWPNFLVNLIMLREMTTLEKLF